MTNLRAIGLTAIWFCSCSCLPRMVGQTLDFQMRQGQPNPFQSTRYPDDQAVAVAATGIWTAKLTGPLADGCYTWKAPCLKLSPATGQGPGNLTISFQGSGAETLQPGVHTSVVEAGAQRWTIRLTVLRRQPYLQAFYRPGFPQGCHNSDPQYPFDDTCQITNEQPPANFTELATPGTSFTDPQFGSPVHRLTESGLNVSYSSMRAFSATGKYILTCGMDGSVQVWDRQSAKKLNGNLGGLSIAQLVWDPTVDDKLWFLNGGALGYVNALTGKQTIAADYGAGVKDHPAFFKMDSGGTADLTDDGWWTFTEENAKTVCAVDLNGLKPANQEDHLYCTSYQAAGVTGVDFPQVTQVDSESHKRYVMLIAEPAAAVLSVDSASHKLKFEYTMPDKISTPHSDVGQDREGRQVFFWDWYDPFGNRYYLATGLLNKGEKITRPIEEGGGLSLLYPLTNGQVRTGMHFGCNWSGYCVVTTFSDPSAGTGGIPTFPISDVKAGSCLVQFAAPYPFADGTRVVIGGVEGMTGVDGVSRIHVVDDKSFTLEDRKCTGTYQGKRGHAAAGRQYVPDSPDREEIVVVRLGGEIRRVVVHRSKFWADQGDLYAYWSSPRASISRDGRYVAYSSNLGFPRPNSVFWAEADLSQEIGAATVTPGDRTATIRWEGPEKVSVIVSTRIDLSDKAFAFRHSASDPREHTIPDLKPDTLYYYRILGENSALSGSFRTAR